MFFARHTVIAMLLRTGSESNDIPCEFIAQGHSIAETRVRRGFAESRARDRREIGQSALE
jgi:hypothetical protein